jgi:hypothetical protein
LLAGLLNSPSLAASSWFPGEAGIGKRRCWTWWPTVWQRQGGAGGECGVKAEADIAFAGPAGLLRLVIGNLDALLAPQSAVAAALALGPPLPRDGLAVCVATPGLLRASGQRQPVLVVIDDFRWLDGVSHECALRAARQAPVAVAFALAVRGAEGADRTTEDLPVLRPGQPGRKNSLQVLSCGAADLATSVAGARVDVAAGNLLALVERPAPLNREQRAGWARLGRPATPGAAPPGVRPPGQRAAWPSAACAGGCDVSGRRPDADPPCCRQRRRRRDAHCAVAGLRSPPTLLTCHDR